VLYAAIAGNLLVALTKFLAAGWTGSSVMWSEAVHSVVDTGNSLLLLYGLHRAKSRPDPEHPFGYGREIYFWSFVVAVLIFAFGAGVSFYEGFSHIRHPEPISDVAINYWVIGVSALLDGTTWWIAVRAFKAKLRWSEVLEAIRRSKDPPSFMVVFEDSAALLGLAIAALGIHLSVLYDLPQIDGIASLAIGALLAVTAMLLARETKGLLIGEAADPPIIGSILRIAAEMDGVTHANGILTVHLGPEQIVAALSLEFADPLTTPDIELKVVELEQRLRRAHPAVVAVFVKPQSTAGYAASMARRYGPAEDLGASRGATEVVAEPSPRLE
jgi:cation diffusion facilitator family transporter